ncbi:MAG: sulfite exporter TauE/SafE family protein [Verrucomicrobiota bacterium]
MKTFVLALLLGGVAGLIGALCGVGGGILMVPAFVYGLGMEPHRAVGTSLAIILPIAVTATLQNHRNGLVDWQIWIGAALGAAVVAWFAADWMKGLQDQTLTRVFAIFLILTGLVMLFGRRG